LVLINPYGAAPEYFHRVNLDTGEKNSFYCYGIRGDNILAHKLLGKGFGELYLIDIINNKKTIISTNEAYYAHLSQDGTYCLIASQTLILYKLKPPFKMMQTPFEEESIQWRTFSLFDYEHIHSIEATENTDLFKISIATYTEPTIVHFNIDTEEYEFVKETSEVD